MRSVVICACSTITQSGVAAALLDSTGCARRWPLVLGLLGALCIRWFGALPPRYIPNTTTAELPRWLQVIASVAELLRKPPPL